MTPFKVIRKSNTIKINKELEAILDKARNSSPKVTMLCSEELMKDSNSRFKRIRCSVAMKSMLSRSK
jgi:hypothetical protein